MSGGGLRLRSLAEIGTARVATESIPTRPLQPVPLIARGEVPRRKMNGVEGSYAAILEHRKRAGEVLWFDFECVTLLLGHDCRYTPDFAVLLADATFELHEVKGPHIREDALVKIKAAARFYPFRFWFMQQAAKKDGAAWRSLSVYG